MTIIASCLALQLGLGFNRRSRCAWRPGSPRTSIPDRIPPAVPKAERPATRFDPNNGRTPAVSQGMVYRSAGLIVPGALCSLSWGGYISAEPAVGDAAQDRDGRGQGPALVVGERFDVG